MRTAREASIGVLAIAGFLLIGGCSAPEPPQGVSVDSAAASVSTVAGSVAAPPEDPTCLPYEPDSVTLTGIVRRRTFYGPPNFGETPEEDARETGLYLDLDAPICMIEKPGLGGAKSGVRTVQIVLMDSVRRAEGRTVVDRPASVHGTLSKP